MPAAVSLGLAWLRGDGCGERMKYCEGAEQASVGGKVRLGNTTKIQVEELQAPVSGRIPDICLRLRAERASTPAARNSYTNC